MKADVNVRTLDRLYAKGIGPARIQLTRRRCGYDVEAFDEWLKSRAFASQAAAIAADATLVVPQERVDRARESRARTRKAKQRQVKRQVKRKDK